MDVQKALNTRLIPRFAPQESSAQRHRRHLGNDLKIRRPSNSRLNAHSSGTSAKPPIRNHRARVRTFSQELPSTGLGGVAADAHLRVADAIVFRERLGGGVSSAWIACAIFIASRGDVAVQTVERFCD